MVSYNYFPHFSNVISTGILWYYSRIAACHWQMAQWPGVCHRADSTTTAPVAGTFTVTYSLSGSDAKSNCSRGAASCGAANCG